MLFRRTKSLVGLDIGSSAVKAIELKPAGKGFRVSAIGAEAIPPDSIVDGAIIDYDLNGETADPLIEDLERRGLPFVLASGANTGR